MLVAAVCCRASSEPRWGAHDTSGWCVPQAWYAVFGCFEARARDCNLRLNRHLNVGGSREETLSETYPCSTISNTAVCCGFHLALSTVVPDFAESGWHFFLKERASRVKLIFLECTDQSAVGPGKSPIAKSCKGTNCKHDVMSEPELFGSHQLDLSLNLVCGERNTLQTNVTKPSFANKT